MHRRIRPIGSMSGGIQVRQAANPNPLHPPDTVSATEATQSEGSEADAGKNSVAIGIIFGTLVGVGVTLFVLYLLYEKRNGLRASRVAWWRTRQTQSQADRTKISDPMGSRASPPTVGPIAEDGYHEMANESQQNLVACPPQEAQKKSILQKLQQALSKASNSRANQEPNSVDMEKGQVPESLESGRTSVDHGSPNYETLTGHQLPAEDVPMQTEPVTAQHPAVLRLTSRKKAGLRPDHNASTSAADTPAALAPPNQTESKNDLLPPPTPSRDARRDTTMTTLTEDMQPTRHRTINSWVANMQTRQEKRNDHLRQAAEANAGRLSTDGASSTRLSAMTIDSDAELQTAQMAWHPPQGAGQVDMPPLPRSASQGKTQQQARRDETCDAGTKMPHLEQAGNRRQDEPGRPTEADSQQVDYADQHNEQQAQEHPQPEVEPELSEHEAQQTQDDPSGYAGTSPSQLTAIVEEDWIPNITRYPSGTTITTTLSELHQR